MAVLLGAGYLVFMFRGGIFCFFFPFLLFILIFDAVSAVEEISEFQDCYCPSAVLLQSTLYLV